MLEVSESCGLAIEHLPRVWKGVGSNLVHNLMTIFICLVLIEAFIRVVKMTSFTHLKISIKHTSLNFDLTANDVERSEALSILKKVLCG